MTSRDFAFWLQGFFEVSEATELTADQVMRVRKHLNLVFKHEIDPSMGDAAHQADLNKVHGGPGVTVHSPSGDSVGTASTSSHFGQRPTQLRC